MNIVNTYVTLYYNMIIAYSLYYLVLSLTSKLPWQECNPDWASPSKNFVKKSFLQNIFLNFNFKDCVDNYNPDVFKYNKCLGNDTLKCDNGKCFNLTSFSGSIANCSYNESLL